MSILLPKGWNIKINWNPQPFLTLCPPLKKWVGGRHQGVSPFIADLMGYIINTMAVQNCGTRNWLLFIGKMRFSTWSIGFLERFWGGASSRTFGSTLTGGFGDDHSEANDLCSFTKNPPWPRFGGSYPARWRVWDLPWPALFLWWTLLQKNVWKMGGYFQREWFRTPHDEPHDQNRCVLQVLNLYRFWPMLMSVQMNRIQVHKGVKKDIASKTYLRKKTPWKLLRSFQPLLSSR